MALKVSCKYLQAVRKGKYLQQLTKGRKTAWFVVLPQHPKQGNPPGTDISRYYFILLGKPEKLLRKVCAGARALLK